VVVEGKSLFMCGANDCVRRFCVKLVRNCYFE